MGERERVEDVRRAGAGDADALQRLIVGYHEALRRVVAAGIDARLRRYVDADDVLQQAYVSAFKKIGEARFGEAGELYKWLERVAVNQLKDVVRGLRRQKRDVAREVCAGADRSASYLDMVERVAGAESTPSRKMARGEAVAAVLSSLARLPDMQREVVRLRFLEDVPVGQIAKRLGKSETAVYTLCHRGLKALRELMVSITDYLTHG